MKLKLIIISALCHSLLSQCSSTASIYQCAESNLGENECMKMNTKLEKVGDIIEQRRVYLLENCSKSEVCRPLEANPNVGLCVEKKSLVSGFDGDSCSNNHDCYSFTCTKGKCVGILNGEKCPGPYSCLKNASCLRETLASAFKCTPIVGPNSSCFTDSMCPFGYICGKSSKSSLNNQCLKMFSIENGSYSTTDLLCKSGKIWTYDKAFNYLCSTSTKSAVEPCVAKNDCKITITNGQDKSFIYKSDTCSWNGLDSYSQITTDEKVFQDYLTTYTELIENLNVKNLKNMEYARKNYWEDVKLASLAKNVFYFAQMKGADDCAIKFFLNSRFNTVTLVGLTAFVLLLV